MKTYNDVKIGDTVYIWGNDDLCVRETKVTQKHYDGYHWCLKFSNKCIGYALENGASSSMGMYACRVFSDKEAVKEYINKRIETLNKIVQEL